MQDFFVKADNLRRKNPVQISGKAFVMETYMKSLNRSINVIKCNGFQLNDTDLAIHIEITDPETGELLFIQTLSCRK